MALPALLWYVVFKYIPLLGSVIAFQDYSIFRGISGSKFVGLANFRKLFAYPDFYNILKNTILKVIFVNTEMNLTQSDVFEGVNPEEYEGLKKQWHLCGETVQKKKKHKIVTVLYPYALGEEGMVCDERIMSFLKGGYGNISLL